MASAGVGRTPQRQGRIPVACEAACHLRRDDGRAGSIRADRAHGVSTSADVRDPRTVGRPGDSLGGAWAAQVAAAMSDPAQPGAVGANDRDVSPRAGPCRAGDREVPAVRRPRKVVTVCHVAEPCPVWVDDVEVVASREGDERPVGRPTNRCNLLERHSTRRDRQRSRRSTSAGIDDEYPGGTVPGVRELRPVGRP